MRVKLKHNEKYDKDYPEFTPGNLYRVIGIEANDYRIIDDTGKPYLYPSEIFDIIEKGGENWETKYGENGEEYSYPKEINQIGFFEDYFDGDKNIIATFDLYMNKLMGRFTGPIHTDNILKNLQLDKDYTDDLN